MRNMELFASFLGPVIGCDLKNHSEPESSGLCKMWSSVRSLHNASLLVRFVSPPVFYPFLHIPIQIQGDRDEPRLLQSAAAGFVLPETLFQPKMYLVNGLADISKEDMDRRGDYDFQCRLLQPHCRRPLLWSSQSRWRSRCRS